MIIRNMCSEDVTQVSALEKRCFSDPWSENSVASELENPLSFWLVAEEEGQVLGYVGSQTVLDNAPLITRLAFGPYASKSSAFSATIRPTR